MYLLVTYDLIVRGKQNYTELDEALGKIGVRATESTWLVSTDGTPAEVVERLRTFLSNEDRLMVIALAPGSDWATLSLGHAAAWLKSNIRP